MKGQQPTLLLITGWAHGPEAVQPLADRFSTDHEVRIMTGAEVLKTRSIPDADCIITGSMGGLLALELLPDRCQKLALISSTAKFCSDAEYPLGTPEKILRHMILQFRRNPAAVLEAFFRNVHYPHESSYVPVNVQDAPSALDELAAGLEFLLASDVRDRMARIRIPILLLHGREDRIIPYAASEWLHDHLPVSTLKIMDGHGHALLAHAFDTCVDEIRRFLEK